MLASYWGKAGPEFAGRHHALLHHALDVAACAERLVETDGVLRRKLTGLLGCGSESVGPTIAFFSSLHDVGKLDARFQIKAPEAAERLQPGLAGKVRRVSYSHGIEGFLQLDDELELGERFGSAGRAMLQAVCGHHGTVPGTGGPVRDLPRAVERRDASARLALLDSMAAFFGARGAVTRLDLPAQENQLLIQLVAGICAVADWVGSNTEWFAYESGASTPEAYFPRALDRATEAVESAGLAPRVLATASFGTIFPGLTPRDVQTLTEQVTMEEPSLIVVEAEMGRGKTEAAIALAARAIARGNGSGIYVGLPTMASSNAMFARIDRVVGSMFQASDARPVHIALAHGRARRNTDFQKRFRERPIHTPYDEGEASVTCARWLLGRKRALLAQVGIGTVDQALQSVLRVDHQFVRLTALARNVVVVDEVHAYDAYMETLLERLMKWLGLLGVSVVLLSATLPAQRRARLAAAWRGRPEAVDSDASAATATPYPLVTEVTRETIRERGFVGKRSGPRRVLGLDARRTIDERGVVAELCTAVRAGARVAWIRNTVGDAQRAWRFVEAERAVTPLDARLFHARFRAKDRRRIEEEVLASFGRDAPAAGRLIIATQVVEQSLDLDFDWLVTDLAPVDLLLQRAGRLHRHEDRARPAGFEAPRLTVLVGSDEDATKLSFGASVYVYDVPTLWLSRESVLAASTWQLPDDIRKLVEETYHSALRAGRLVSGPADLGRREEAREKDAIAREGSASQIVIGVLGSSVSDDDDSVQALTRDGRSEQLLPIWWDGEQARSLDGEHWQLDPKHPNAWSTLDAMQDETLSVPSRQPITGAVPHGETAAWDEFRARFEHFGRATNLSRVCLLPMHRVLRSDGAFQGSLRQGERRRSVLYTPSLGLHFIRESE